MAHRLSVNPKTPQYHDLTTHMGHWKGEIRRMPEVLEKPLHWRKPRRIFVCSMGDLFHEKVPFEYIAAVFGVMAACPQHTFIVLTKRPERMLEWFEWVAKGRSDFSERIVGLPDRVQIRFDLLGFARSYCRMPDRVTSEWPLPNVVLMTTAENQPAADQRIPVLLQCPAAAWGVSIEPMLGSVGLGRWLPPP
jgi:protein gp37